MVDEEKGRKIKQWFIDKMMEIRNMTNTGFVGLAIYDVMNEELRWRIAVGNLNERYKRIVIRLGKGIAGEVVQLNRPIKIENFPDDCLGDPIEYPILLVEQLISVLAVPVAYNQHIFGVLMIGQRKRRKFSLVEENYLREMGNKFAEVLANANVYQQIKDEEDSVASRMEEYQLIKFLKGMQKDLTANKRGRLTYQILDQSVIELPILIAENIKVSLQEICEIILTAEQDYVDISFGRDDNFILIEVISNRSYPNIRESLNHIYQRIGEIGGFIFLHHTQDELNIVLEIPLWSIHSPI